MPSISKDCSNTFLERSFIYAASCEWNKFTEHIRTLNFDCSRTVLKQCYLYSHMKLTENSNVYIIVIYVVITVKYCKYILLSVLL